MTAANNGSARGLAEWLVRWPGFLALLACYIALHFALRLALSPTVGVDDVAEGLFAQSLQWTYYPRQPPLYTWLLWGSFRLFGVTVAALAFLKYALVALGYLFFYLSARRMFADRRIALLAALSPSLIYAVGYGVHLGFTNTVLLTAACAATFYVLLRVIQDGRTGDYVALGVAIGIGLLSKWGYPAFIGALSVAALMQEPSRRSLRDPRILLTLIVTAALVTPYFLWGFHSSAVHNVFNGVMRRGGQAPYFAGVATGLQTLAIAITMFLAPLWLIALAIFPKALAARRHAARPGGLDSRRLLEHFFLAMLVIVLAGVFIAGITFYKSRWMHPVLILFPLYFFCLVEDAGFSPRRLRVFVAVLAVAAVAVIAARLLQDVGGPPFCGKCRMLRPYPELAREIESRGFSGGTIVAGDEHIAGNFRVAFSGSRVATSKYAFYVPPPPAPGAAGQCLVVWDAHDGDAVPPALAQFLKEAFDAEPPDGPVQSVEAPYRHTDLRTLRLDFVALPATGTCR
ncbi:MAG TPA: glycosyltransferase family 39 protein [Alphaproteobacteria bacterium]|nr:glycosyltransferase family 39 protein [Alphaproteobacteria bacterium]